MDMVTSWLAGSTWRRVHLFQYGGRFTAEAHEYPQMNEHSVVVATGEGATPEEALAMLDITMGGAAI